MLQLQALIRTHSRQFLNIRRFIHSSPAPAIRETGLYGFDHLKTAKGFQRMADDAIERWGFWKHFHQSISFSFLDEMPLQEITAIESVLQV